MRRQVRQRIAVIAALAALGSLLPAGQAVAGISLSPTRDARFPDRAFVLTLPQHSRLVPGQVRVTENGEAVRRLRVAPAGAGRRVRLGVVLAVDASSSMRGAAFAQAIEAARAFANERNGRQPFSLVTFGTGSRVVLPFTDDEQRIEAALADPGTPAGGTDMYDAALRSVKLVESAGLRGGFVVVLSDGADHGSAATADDVVAAARAANVKVYSVGLASASFEPAALERLAVDGGGEYSEASSADQLQDIYGALGAQLSNAHVLTYRSLVGPGRRVEVRASVAGLGTATADYRSPRLAIGGKPASGGGGWDSPVALIVAVLVVAGLLALALVVVLRGPRQSPRERVAQFVGGPSVDPERATLTGRLAKGAERSLGRTGWWDGFATEVDVAGIRYTPGQVVVASSVIALSLAFLGASVTGAGLAGIGCLLLAPLIVWTLVHARAERERKLFGDQLAAHLAVVGGSLRVGHSLTAALAAALDDAPEPARREFARAVADESLGRPLEDALEEICHRMDNREVEHVSLLAKLQREAGADAAEMVDQVVTTVRERQELRRTVRTLTAQGRLAQAILSVLPGAALLLMSVTNPPYVEPLFHTGLGHAVLAAAAALVVVGSLVIRKIVTIKV